MLFRSVAGAFELLLYDAGYQVIPTGIERSLRELRSVDRDRYIKLAHPRLRTTPDCFVLDLEGGNSWLTEVKYRRYMSERLLKGLEEIRQTWSPYVLVLVLAEPPEEWTGDVSHIRAFEIDERTDLTLKYLLEDGSRLQDVFVRLKERRKNGTILSVQEAIKRLVVQEHD